MDAQLPPWSALACLRKPVFLAPIFWLLCLSPSRGDLVPYDHLMQAMEDHTVIQKNSMIRYIARRDRNFRKEVRVLFRGTGRVDRHGYVRFPTIGKVMAAGISISDLKSKVTAECDRSWRTNEISVGLSFRPNAARTDKAHVDLYWDGAIMFPGPVDWYPRITLLEALKEGGGITLDAFPHRIGVIRGKLLERFNLNDRTSWSYPLQEGDKIFVDEAPY